MQKIAIITDSACDLPDKILEEFKVDFLSLHVNFEEEEYLDRRTITPAEFYAKLKSEIPKTSLPSPQEALKLLERLHSEGYTHVIALHLSSGLSGTYNMMVNIAKEYKDMVIEVIDTKTLSMGLGFAVLEAARALQKTPDFHTVIKHIKAKLNSIHAFFVIPSLEYLRKGGRIGRVSGTIGDLMQIKPIISIDEEGKYFNYDKVRGRKQSLNRLLEIAKEITENKLSEVAVLHGEAEEEALKLLENIKKLPSVKDTFFSQISPALGVHTGPGLVAVVVNTLK